MPGFSDYSYSVCCEGSELDTLQGSLGDVEFFTLSSDQNAHFGLDSYSVPVGFSSPAGLEFVFDSSGGFDNFSSQGSNHFLPLVSFSSRVNGHFGGFEVYDLKLYARAGVVMSCGAVKHPFDSVVVGAACDDSPRDWDFDGSVEFVSGFCNSSSACVALNESSGLPECFSQGTVLDVDDFAGGLQNEECVSHNRWCPEGFQYDPDLGPDGWCWKPEEVCYDSTDPGYCNELERDNVSTVVQFEEWLDAYDTCSYYEDSVTGSTQSCCLVAEIGGVSYQYDSEVCVFVPGGDNSACE